MAEHPQTICEHAAAEHKTYIKQSPFILGGFNYLTC